MPLLELFEYFLKSFQVFFITSTNRRTLFVCIFNWFTDLPSQEQPVGEVNVQVDLFTHPGTGEQKVTVKSMFIPTLGIFILQNT